MQSAPVSDPQQLKRVFVVFNPAKKAPWQRLRALVDRIAAESGFAEPQWLATTREDPGAGQARQAVAKNAALVIAAGGDGTIRLVAGVLEGTGIPLALLPVGTGNLFAQNMRIPINDVEAAVRIAFSGHTTPIDLGWMHLIRTSPLRHFSRHAKANHTQLAAASAADKRSERDAWEPFLIVGGTGFDAETMAATNAQLKKVIGVLAYFQAAIPNLLAHRFPVQISAANLSHTVATTARSVMFVNCPELNNGIVLDPSAQPDDGALNLNVLDIYGGLIGWTDLIRRVGMSWIGLRSRTKGVPMKPVVGGVRVHKVRECTLQLHKLHKVQADGDVVGTARIIQVSASRHAIHVCVPA